jgi:hypothetical protein
VSFFRIAGLGMVDLRGAGLLVRVLEDWRPYYPGFPLYYPTCALSPISSAAPIAPAVRKARNKAQVETHPGIKCT